MKENITLKHIEQFDNLYLDMNIFLDTEYAPFQRGISWGDISQIVPIENNFLKFKDFLRAALQLKKAPFWDYERLLKSMKEKDANNE